jgi:hypothetical protein
MVNLFPFLINKYAMEVQFHTFLTPSLMEISGQLQALSASTPPPP